MKKITRDIETTKNRFGSCSFLSFPLTTSGFVFESVKLNKDTIAKRPTTSKKDNILLLLETSKTIVEIVRETKISTNYIATLLRDLLIEGKITKKGRGVSASYKKI